MESYAFNQASKTTAQARSKPVNVKQQQIDRFEALMATLASEIDAHNDLVRRFNDQIFDLHQEVERTLESANEIICQLQDVGEQVCTDLRTQAEAEGLDPDHGQAEEMLESWAVVASLPELEPPECVELDEIVLGSRRYPLPTPMTGPVSEAEALLQQRIEALQLELNELKKRRQVQAQNRRPTTG